MFRPSRSRGLQNHSDGAPPQLTSELPSRRTMGFDPAARSQLDNVAKDLVITWASSARQDGETSRTARDCFEGAVAIRYILDDVQPLHICSRVKGYVGHHYVTPTLRRRSAKKRVLGTSVRLLFMVCSQSVSMCWS